jgi:hypothetical protein
MVLRDLSRALPTLTGDDHTTAARILARPTDGAADQYGDGYSVPEATPVCGPDVCVHYVTSTADAATPAQVTLTLNTMEHVYTTETGTGAGQMGFRKPLSDGSKGGDGRLDVYLADVGAEGYYGYCSTDPTLAPGIHQSAYCVLDNDFRSGQFGGALPVNSLDVTAAHEFFHAVQFSYDFTEDTWFMEGTAVWMEDQVYDSINDYLQYAPFSAIGEPRVPVDYAGEFERYGAFLFWKFLSEKTHDNNIIRDIWTAADGSRFSTQAVRAVLAARGLSWTTYFANFGAWNTLPGNSYQERALYPAVKWWQQVTLTKSHRASGLKTVTLRHLSNASMRIFPSKGLTSRAKLRITVNGPGLTLGTAATIQVRRGNGKVEIWKINLNSAGNGTATVAFPPKQVRAVAVVLTNSSPTMTSCGTDPNYVYSCAGRAVYDSDKFTIRANLL